MAWRKTDTGIVHFVSTKSGLWTDIVSEELSITIDRLLEMAAFGCIYLNDSRIYSSCEIKDQDYLRIHTDPRRFPRLPLLGRIVFQNQSLLIVNKPSGLPCHPTVDNLKENLLFDLQAQMEMKLYPTHRLDVPTSGLIVLTKTPEAQLEFQNLLKDKKVHKIYRAHVPAPGPALGFYEHHMEKSRYAPKTLVDAPRATTQVCQLKVLKKEILNDEAALQVELITGRTHQIRAQLSYLGYPIIGDSLYSDFDSRNADEKIKLCCIRLSFLWQQQNFACDLTTYD